MTVDHFNPEPKYLRIAATIRERIRSGELEPLQRVPGETQSVRIHGVARKTARMALGALAAEGWGFILQSRGTYVSERDKWPAEPAE
ncbi:GntR family transcriptional regulator [Streptosporangium subroseum]|uniref:GntR family transcriptional regulator n=1 Tax=Streptosporangium subroseum TaxID=106412 RepID=UPI00343CDEAC